MQCLGVNVTFTLQLVFVWFVGEHAPCFPTFDLTVRCLFDALLLQDTSAVIVSTVFADISVIHCRKDCSMKTTQLRSVENNGCLSISLLC